MTKKVKITAVIIAIALAVVGLCMLGIDIYNQYIHGSKFWGEWVSEDGISTFICSYDEESEVISYTLYAVTESKREIDSWGIIYKVEDVTVLFIDQTDPEGGVEKRFDYEITADQLTLNGSGMEETFIKKD